LELTILGYALAMLSYAAEYAFGTRGVVARIASRERVLVGAGGPPVVDTAPAPVAENENPTVARFAGQVGLGLTVTGWLLHLSCIVTRGLAAHRVPWGNMYEFVLAVCFVGATAWLILLQRRPAVRQ